MMRKGLLYATLFTLLNTAIVFGQQTPKVQIQQPIASGTVLVSPEPFELPTFTRVDFYSPITQNTTTLYTGIPGPVKYSLSLDSAAIMKQGYQTYTVTVAPDTLRNPDGVVSRPISLGDNFQPYTTTIDIKPGENSMQTLLRPQENLEDQINTISLEAKSD